MGCISKCLGCEISREIIAANVLLLFAAGSNESQKTGKVVLLLILGLLSLLVFVILVAVIASK